MWPLRPMPQSTRPCYENQVLHLPYCLFCLYSLWPKSQSWRSVCRQSWPTGLHVRLRKRMFYGPRLFFNLISKSRLVAIRICSGRTTRFVFSFLYANVALEIFYIVTKIVLTCCEKNCSSDQENFLNLRLKAKNLQHFWGHFNNLFKQWKKGQNNFWQQNTFLTCSWRFLNSQKFEQLEFKLEKNIAS